MLLGSFIERKKIALTWHYRRADPEYGAFQARECQKHLENTVAKNWDVEVMTGKANLEVRPRFVNKGEIAKRLIQAYGDKPGEPPEFVLCLGDDFTDEGQSLLSSHAQRDLGYVCLVIREQCAADTWQICSALCGNPNCLKTTSFPSQLGLAQSRLLPIGTSWSLLMSSPLYRFSMALLMLEM